MENKQTILIVEDEEPLLNLLTEKFIKEGFLVFGAKDGEEGLKLAFKNHPDIILLDILMPKVDGMMALRSLRQDAWGGSVPVIFLTNLKDPAKKVEALEYGVEFLVKSDWKIDDIVGKVRQKLSQNGKDIY